ncbi:MAG: DUF58 domain-containing protein [Thalassotalea sp.]|nr:DUF58 domain-containing protein [Thalassotalea sp.]
MQIQIKHSLNQLINQRFTLWLNRRMPSKASQKLAQKNIFILPTRFGLAFIVFIILLFILGTNYQNNLIIIMCYLFSSLFITTMFYSFFNMAGLSISAKGTYRGYQDELVSVPVQVAAEQIKQSFSFNFSNHQQVDVCVINESKTIILPVKFYQRGKRTLNRLIISSEYPLGLFKCWTKLQFDIDVIIYPKPLKCSFSSHHANTEMPDELQENHNDGMINGEDFYELKHYQKGEPLSHVAWKQVAKGDVWQTKHYSQPQSHAVLLSLNEMPSHSLENKLSNLCYLVLQYHQAGVEFALNLEGFAENALIETGSGEQHLKECLSSLATFHKNPTTHNYS